MSSAEPYRAVRSGAVVGTSTDRRQSEELAEEIRSLSGHGRPLRLRLKNFRPTGDDYLSALAGPRPYMIRLREIARLTAEHELLLGDAREALRASGLDADAFAAAWRAQVEGWSFAEINNLIDRHNRFYPVESRLPMDPRTGTYALVAGKEYRLRPLDAIWALERFPPDVREASASFLTPASVPNQGG
jgi:hypothetical protein